MVNKNKNSTSSNDGVVGLVFIVRDLSHVFPDAKGKRAWVRRTEVGSAAAAEGKLEAGDELIRIGDTDRIFVKDMLHTTWEAEDLGRAMAGPAGTVCHLTFYNHQRKEEYSLKLTRRARSLSPSQPTQPSFLPWLTLLSLSLLRYFIIAASLLGSLSRLPFLLSSLPDAPYPLHSTALSALQTVGPVPLLAAFVVTACTAFLFTGPFRRSNGQQKARESELGQRVGWTEVAWAVWSVLLHLVTAAGLVYGVDEGLMRWERPADPRLRGHVGVVTGCEGTLGVEVTRHLQMLGATLVMLCHSRPACAAQMQRLTSTFTPAKGAWAVMGMEVDLCSRRSVEDFVGKFRRDYGRLDILVLTAGSLPCGTKGGPGPEPDDWIPAHVGQRYLALQLRPDLDKSLLHEGQGKKRVTESDGGKRVTESGANGRNAPRVIATAPASHWLAGPPSKFKLDVTPQSVPETAANGTVWDPAKALYETVVGWRPASELSDLLFYHELGRDRKSVV